MSASDTNQLFDVAIATIFAREVLEGAIIIVNYRSIIKKSPYESEEKRAEALKAVTKWALIASGVAILVVLAVAIPLGLLSKELDIRVVEVIEGSSKVIAAVCILQLSLKIPAWLGLYAKVSILPCRQKVLSFANHSLDEQPEEQEGVTLKEIRFNVSWNLWREVAECGVFLIPFFLGGPAKAIPLSALVGIAISLVIGGLMYIANQRMKSKVWLAAFMSLVTGFLAVGMFTSGCHKFEQVWGETPTVWTVSNPAMSDKKLPMVLIKPFGYSSSRTVLQIVCFWSWLLLSVALHGLKFRATKIYRELLAANELTRKETDVSSAENGEIDATRQREDSSNDNASADWGPNSEKMGQES